MSDCKEAVLLILQHRVCKATGIFAVQRGNLYSVDENSYSAAAKETAGVERNEEVLGSLGEHVHFWLKISDGCRG